MNRNPNTTDKVNTQPVFNYAQAAKKSSQIFAQTQNATKQATSAPTEDGRKQQTKVEAAAVKAPSFAAALSKNSSANATPQNSAKGPKSYRNPVQLPKEAENKTGSIQFGSVQSNAEIKTAESETNNLPASQFIPRRNSTHFHYSNHSGIESQHRNNDYYNRNNSDQGKHSLSPNMQQPYVPLYHKKSAPTMNSWQGNQYQPLYAKPTASKIRITNPNTSEPVNFANQFKVNSNVIPSSTVTPPFSRAIKIVNPKEKEEAEQKFKEKAEKMEAEKKAKEEAERKAKEEAEQKAKEEAEKIEAEKLAKEEAEKKAKEEAEKKIKEEAERKIKEEAEKKAKEEAEKLEVEKLAKEEAERKVKEQAEKEEAEKKAKEEAEKRVKEEAERKVKEEAEKVEAEKIAKEEAEKKAKEEEDEKKAKEEESKVAEAKAKEESEKNATEKVEANEEGDKKAVAEEERIANIAAAKITRSAAPGRLDISAIPAHVFHDSPVSTPTSSIPPKVKRAPMKVIEDFSSITYPPEFLAPKARDASGRIRYEHAFLLQFQQLCLQTDEDLSAFENVGEDPFGGDNKRSMSRRQNSERGRGPRTPGGPNDYGRNSRDNRGDMDKLSGRALSHRQGSNGPNSPGMERQGSQGGRNRSSRGGGKGRRTPREQIGAPTIPLDQVVPLEMTGNRWIPAVVATEGVSSTTSEVQNKDAESDLIPQEIITRKVNSLLNKLTIERFDSISGQIWDYAKQSEREDNGQSLRTVIHLIFNKACDEPAFAGMWAKLCKRLFDIISDTKDAKEIKDVNLTDSGKPVCNGPLYRKYLLTQCQEQFEKGWKSDLPTLTDADEMLTEEYYEAAKVKRRGLGLVQLVGELYKYDILIDRVMLNCLERLSADHKNPNDEETETLCKLLTTMGKAFDGRNRKNSEWLDFYFKRMDEMYKTSSLSSRVKFMIMDIADLRKNKWVPKNGNQPAPTTLAQIHEQAKKGEEEAMKRTSSSRGSSRPVSRQSSHRGGREMPRQNSSRGMQNKENNNDASAVSSNGWNTVSGSPSSALRVGRTSDLSSPNKYSRGEPRVNVLSPSSSPFQSLSRTSSDKKSATTDGRSASPATSMSNMFSALGNDGNEEEHTGERKKLQLLPRSANGPSESAEKPEEVSEEKPKLSDELIERKSKGAIDEYFSLRDKKELCECVKELDHTDYHVIFASKLLDVVEKKDQDVDIVCEMIEALHKENIIQREEYVAAFKKFWIGYEDLVIDVPQAPKHVEKLLKATGIERAEVECESQY